MKEKKTIITLLLITLSKTILFSHYGFGLVDEGESLHNAQRILAGDLPYRDFFAIFPPLDNYFYALTFWLFGESVFIPRLIASLIFVATPVLIFLIARRFMPYVYALLPAILIIFLDVNIERLFFFTPLLLGFYFFLLALEDKRWGLFLGSGLLFGLASLIRFDIPGAFGLAAIIGLAVNLYLVSKKTWVKKWLFSVFLMGSGFILPVGGVTVWMASQGILSSFLEHAFVKAVVITRLHALPFPSIADLLPFPITLTNLSEAYTAVYGYSMLAVYAASIILLTKQRALIWKKTPEIGILWLSGIFTLPYIFGRTEIGHMVKGGVPFLFLGAYLLYRANKTRYLSSRLFGWGLVGSIFLANLTQTIWWLNFNNQKMVLAGNTIRLNSEYIENSTIPSARTLERAVSFLHSNSKEGEPVLTVPYMAGLYFLSNRPSPTEFNNVLAGFITTEEEQLEFIQKVEKSQVKLAIYDPNNGPKMKTSRMKDYNPLIHNYIMKNFEIVEQTQEGWLFMKEKNE